MPRRRPASTAELLPIDALSPSGLLTREDGTPVRLLEVTPANPLALDDDGAQRATRALTALITRIPPNSSIQAYVTATPIALDDLLARTRQETDAATGDPLRPLAQLHERSLTTHAQAQAALDLRFVLVVPQDGAHRLTGALSALDLKATPLNGAQVAALLHARFTTGATTPDLDALTPAHVPPSPEQARRAAQRLRAAIATAPIDTTDRRHLTVDGLLEQTIHLSATPQRTFFGWLLHAMRATTPWTLSVHVHARDRRADRDAVNRRARRLWGVNQGATGRPDREQRTQQDELEDLYAELGTGAEILTDTSVYLTLRALDEATLHEAVTQAIGDLRAPTDAAVATGHAIQRDLFTSSLPLALDQARRTIRLISRNAADTLPFVSTACGSPQGIPLGFADPGRTLQRLNPFDRVHDNGTTLLFAKSGGGKTMTTIAMISAAIPRGCQVNVVDRSAGHYEYLTRLVPGAAHVELGQDHGINPWDGEPTRAKIAFLVALHALLIGEHADLTPLERNLLAIAIRKAYENETPTESGLHATLVDLARDEHPETAAVYRNLALRLSEYTGEGTYAYLFDRPTTIAAHDAPLVVFNTSRVPDDVAAPVIFAVLELITRRVEARAHKADKAGPFDGTSAIVIEELWKLLERRATGAWVNELAKRARHLGLWLVAITQQRSDLDSPQGRALLDNSTIQIFLRNGPEDVAHIADKLRLTDSEVAQISRLSTEKGSHAEAYVINGERGRGTVTIRLGPELYWLATSDPITDVPRRDQALDDAGGDPWAALRRLGAGGPSRENAF